MNPEMIRALGRLHFRTSYGQNVLAHSKEVAVIAGMLASELGANRELAKRGALLHDIGKGVETDSDQNHAEVGMEMARKLGEDPRVVNAIGSHHDDVEPSCLESVICQIADAISAARPGARREAIDNYAKRLENLEGIAESFSGVDKAYAIQAGRELRILVNNESVSDEQSKDLAKQIAKLESDLALNTGKLANPNFSKAPPAVQQKTHDLIAQQTRDLEALKVQSQKIEAL